MMGNLEFILTLLSLTAAEEQKERDRNAARPVKQLFVYLKGQLPLPEGRGL